MWRWLDETRELQISAYGTDPAALEGDELADFIIWNHTAAVVELSEFLAETKWKPWVKTRGIVNRSEAIDELVDVAHFIANLAVAMGCDDDEWERRYVDKMIINRARQANGYEGRFVAREGNEDTGWLATDL